MCWNFTINLISLWFSQTYLKFVEQLLQRHLLFRNTLQERLSAEHWKSLVGDILVQLIGQNDVSLNFFVFFVVFMISDQKKQILRAPVFILTFVSDSIFRYVRWIYYYTGVLPLAGVQQTESSWEKPQSAGISGASTLFTHNGLERTDMLMNMWFHRAARWRGRKWNCSLCCWLLSLVYTATWVTFRWVSSLGESRM